MSVLLVSQNRSYDSERDERIDCTDSRLIDFLTSLSFSAVTLPNSGRNSQEVVSHIRPYGIVLAGGNNIGDEPERDATELNLLDYATAQCIPVLGICRGMQFMNHYLGGTLRGVTNHAGTPHPIRGENLGFSRSSVNSFHHYQLDRLGAGLRVAARSDDEVVEAVTHSDYRWLGIMWHPEREAPFDGEDLRLVAEFFDPCRRKES